jgi:uncharacterized membrane protein
MLAAHRPELVLPPTASERIAEIAGGVLISAVVVFAAVVIPRLPASVPVHFGADGRPDAWGAPSSLLLLPALGVVFYLGLTVLQRYPQIYNYPTIVTRDNAAALYRTGRQFVLATKIFITTNLAIVFYGSVSLALGGPDVLGPWFLPTVFVSLGAVLSVFVARMLRVRSTQKG